MADFVLEPGTTISHFRLEKKLGEGGMGAVFLAEDLTLSRRVAIKFMSRALLAQVGSSSVRESIEKRFIREARSAAAINHPNLAQIYEANFESDNWYIAMEYIDGQSLEAYVNPESPVSVKLCVDILRQVVKGLQFAWDTTTIVHRDIKPGNIMVTGHQLVKIVDLGLAKPVANVSAEDEAAMPDITCAGTPIGTPQYMAPEQATGETDIDFKIDIFALGATMYEILAGRKCFQERTAALIYMAQMGKKYKPLSEYRNDVPEALATLIDQMLEPSTLDRIESYDAILQALDSIETGGDNLDMTLIAMNNEDLGSAPTVAEAMLLTGGGKVGSKSAVPTDYYPNDYLIQERYRVIRPIGKSRAGHVYMCTDTQLGVEVAVKTLYPGREFAPGQMDLVRENFQKLLSMSNPHLVQIRDLSVHAETGELYVVMELLRGQNLRQWTHKRVTELGTLTVDAIRPVMRQVAAAVDSVNKTFGTIHNDLKPESIFLTDDGARVVLLDYGITFMPPPEVSRAEGTHIPLDAMPMPSPDYMAPEQWRMQPQTLQTDQYSLGVILYEMLTHKLPFWLRDPSVEAAAKEKDDKRPLLHIQLEAQFRRVVEDAHAPLPNLTRAENAALAKGMAKTPAERFPTCIDFVDELCGKPSSGGAGKIILAVAALAVIGIGVAAAVVLSGDKDDPQIPPDPTNTVQVPPDDTTPPVTPPPVTPPDTTVDTVVVTPPVTPPDTVDTPPDLPPDATDAQVAQRIAMAKRTIDEFAKEYTEQRARLAAVEGSADAVARVDALVAQATAATAAAETIDDYKAVIASYRDIIDATLKEKAALDNQRAAALTARATAIRETRETLRPYEALDTTIAENIAKFDRAESDAARALRAEKWPEAAAHLESAEGSLKAIQDLVRDTYTPQIGKNFTVPDVGMEFVWIESMECWVAKYETTNAQFRKFKATHNSGMTKEELPLNGDTQPVVLVSYFRAVEYCSWMTANSKSKKLLPDGYTFRLPNKDEWVYFSTCGEDRLYPWGNDLPPKYGNFGNPEMFKEDYDLGDYEDPYLVTCPVEKSGANDWGLYGTAGNVWEWTTDDKNGKRGVFGGSWTDAMAAALRAVPQGFNYADPAIADFDSIGFRVILAPPPEKN